MSEGENYGKVGASTQTANQGAQTTQAAQTKAGEVAPPVSTPEKEVDPEQNIHVAAQELKGIAYKKVQTTTFCFDCGRQAEYFANNWGKWEKYLCAEDMKKELEKAKTEYAQSQAGSTQAPPQTEPPKSEQH